jgi:hypothetical protein
MTFALFGSDLFGVAVTPAASGPLARDFVFPPFSVLDARSGDWQERKRAWLAVGIKSEVGRDNEYVSGVASIHRGVQGDITAGTSPDIAERFAQCGTGDSIFDPVLTELAYRWFSPPAGHVLDPFAGGSVRGIIAALLGREYTGIDLRPEQVAANVEQADAICPGHRPRWIAGDSRDLAALAPGLEADLVFSCPPYYDLERYSDDHRDLSVMDWHDFRVIYARIIKAAAERLRPNRFACFVVGDVRDPAGMYRDLPGETIRAFRTAGMHLYNEAVLVTPTGTLPIRVRGGFDAARKLGKAHQNVLVFVKGDPAKAAEACGS